jgi:ATP-dependent helicase/nuclease subunit A
MTDAKSPPLRDQPDREKISTLLDTSMLVEAAAGTGKTTSMIGRITALIAEGRCGTDSMAAITFTRTAAAELRSRLQLGLETAVKDETQDPGKKARLATALETIDRCFVGTIHSFCGRLLRELPVEAGIDVGFGELEESEDQAMIDRAWEAFVFRQEKEGTALHRALVWLAVPYAKLRKGFGTFCANPDVTWPVEPTELPVERVAQVAGALEQYLDHMRGLGLKPDPDEKEVWQSWRYRHILRLAAGRDLSSIDNLLVLLEEFKKPGTKGKGWPEGVDPEEELSRWTDFIAVWKDPFLAELRRHRYRFVIQTYQGAMGEYDRLRAEAGVLSFGDLLQKAAALLEDEGARDYFRSRCSHLLVDEFQDTDPVQAKVMLLLSAPEGKVGDWRAVRPRPGSLFVVGDPKQSIYRFRRADIGTYEEVKRAIRESGGEVLTLSTNFRSTRALIDAVNGFFADRMIESESQPAYVPLSPTGEEDPAGDLAGVAFLSATIAVEESERIARFIRHAVDSGATVPRRAGGDAAVTWGDFLILARVGKRLDRYGEAFQRYRIPHEVIGGAALAGISALHHLRDCLAAVVEPENPVPLVALLRGPLFGVSDAALLAYREAGGRFLFLSSFPEGCKGKEVDAIRHVFERLRKHRRWLGAMPVASAVERIAADLGIAPLAGLGADGNLQAGGVGKALRLLEGAGTAQEALEQLDGLLDSESEVDPLPAIPPTEAVVRVMTTHKSKGLEAPVVFLADPSGEKGWPLTYRIVRTGSLPRGYLRVAHKEKNPFGGGQEDVVALPPRWIEEHVDAERPFVDDEQERLRYVAATRAGAQLVIGKRGKNPESSFWLPFCDLEAKELAVPAEGSVVPPVDPPLSMTPEEIAGEVAAVGERRKALLSGTFRTVSARGLAAIGAAPGHGVGGSETDGQQKGRAIHALLEAALRHPGADLAKLAVSVIAEGEFPEVDLDEAVAMARSVAASDLWRRAQASSRCLTEAPFTRMIPADHPDAKGLPTLLRGVIDLAFLEPDGWVIVDWKSNPISPEEVEATAERYAPQVALYKREWEAITGEKVKETGLFFTAPRVYLPLG